MKKVLIAVVLGLSFGYFASLPAQAEPKPYTVHNGNKVDADTYKGFTLYRNWCARCHGTFGQGLAGPDLTISLNKITYDEFMTTVAEGKAGQLGVMPAWKANSTVMQGRDGIYSYLKARADGVLDAVKPEKAQ